MAGTTRRRITPGVLTTDLPEKLHHHQCESSKWSLLTCRNPRPALKDEDSR